MIAENTRKVSRNLGCKSDGLDRRPENVEVLIPEVIQVSSTNDIEHNKRFLIILWCLYMKYFGSV